MGDLTRHSLYTPELNLMSETESSTTTTPAVAYDYIWFGGKPVAQIDLATNTNHYTFTDHLGTPIMQTSSTGAIDWQGEYESYGSVYTMRVGTGRHEPLRLPGQENDTADGAGEYNIFRWFRPHWGRYTQADRFLSVATEPNVFTYAQDNAIRFVDRVGLFSIDSSCDCPASNNIPKIIAQAAKYINAPKCQSILQNYSYVPFNGNGSTKEPLLDCMKRRFGPKEVGLPPVIRCFKGDGDGACGQMVPGAFGGPTTIKLWPDGSNCPNKNPAFGLKQTLFHETLHSCGAELEDDTFAAIQKVCTGL